MNQVVQIDGAEALEITARSARLLVIAETGREDVEIDGLPDRGRRRQVWHEDGRLHVRGGRRARSLTVRCPVGIDILAASNSGPLELQGELGELRLFSHSGEIRVERARSLEARTTSGRIEVGRVDGPAITSTVSGAVRVDLARSARSYAVSGEVNLRVVEGQVEARSVNGVVKVTTDGAGEIVVSTLSGSINIVVPEGCRPDVRARRKVGQPSITCERGNDIPIRVETMTGAVNIGSDR